MENIVMDEQISLSTNKLHSLAKVCMCKYNVPNILNDIGIRIINFCNKVGLVFNGVVLVLNIKQENYSHNHKIIVKCTHVINKLVQPNYNKIVTKPLDIKTWCEQQNLPYITVDQQIDIAAPKLIEPPSNITQTSSGTAILPNAYLAEIDDATLIAGSKLILTDKNRVILNDEIYTDKQHRYNLKNPFIKYSGGENLKIGFIKKMNLSIPIGIHFCDDYSHKYFHWLVECLPRFFILDQFTKYDTLPLLIDEGLTSQQEKALNIMNSRNRQMIRLKKGHAYHINKLIIPSTATVIHDNYHSPVTYDNDVLLSPDAIHYVRDIILRTLDCMPKKGFRKLFISRKNSNHRRLLNLEEIESLMVQKGFEIVFPEILTFDNQVKLFSQAEVIISQTGAGLANLMFCPENCKAIILINHHPQTNYRLFSNFAQILNIDLQFLPGTDVIEHVDKSEQNDYIIHKDLLSNTIYTVCNSL